MAEWIPVSERSPRLREYVVAWETEGELHCTISQYRGSAGWFGPWDEKITVTHWMPLPPPPHPEYPQHCTTPEPCIAAGRCTRDPNCID